MSRRFPIPIGPLVLAPLCCLAGCLRPPPDLLPDKSLTRPAKTWKADPKLLDLLAEETTLEGLRFRPPIGYQPFNVPLRSGHASGWIGSKRKDGAPASIVVSVIPGKVDNEVALSLILDGSLTPYKHRHAKDWTRSDPKRGKIADLACLRSHWSGTCTEGQPQLIGKPVRGIVFVGAYGDKVVQVLIKGAVPEDETSLPLCEASALTLHKASDE
jgi:hypothetical protein